MSGDVHNWGHIQVLVNTRSSVKEGRRKANRRKLEGRNNKDVGKTGKICVG